MIAVINVKEESETADGTPKPAVSQQEAGGGISPVYSGTDFFYEGQELRPEEKDTSPEIRLPTNRTNDRFYGHFNTFF
jgi:hypothetical protein